MKRRNRWLSMLLTITMMTTQIPVSPVIAADDDSSYEVCIEEMEEDAAEDEAEVIVPETDEEISVEGDTVLGEQLPVVIEEAAENAAAEDEDIIVDEDDVVYPGNYAYVEDRIISMASDEKEAEEIAAAYNAKVESFSYGLVVIDLKGSGYTVASAVDAYQASNGELPYIEPDYIAESALTIDEMTAEESQYAQGNDLINTHSDWIDMYSSMSNPDPALNPSSSTYQWYHDMIGTYEAWAMSKGSPDVVTAIISDFAKHKHEDIKINTIFPFENQLTSYDNGTPLAGIIAGKRDNGVGGAGIAPNTTLFSVNANDSTGVMTTSRITEGILKVSNLKFTGDLKKKVYKYGKLGDKSRAQIILVDAQLHAGSDFMRTAIKVAHDEMNVTIIAPAGDYDSEVQCFPAEYSQVISVAAVDSNGEKTARSSYGTHVDVAAPGYQIYAPSGRGGVSDNTSEYTFVTGTSAAAAMVAGACALYMSTEGWVKPDTMKEALVNNVKPVTTVSENGLGVTPGKGIISLPDMLGASDLVPRIRAYENSTSEFVITTVTPVNSGEKAYVPSSGVIKFDALKKTVDKNGKNQYTTEIKDINLTYVYTLDGNDPEVIEKNGSFYTGANTYIAYGAQLTLDELIDKSVRGAQDIHLRVRCVNTKGKVSRTVSIKISTNYESSSIISVNVINAPTTLIAGKKVTLKAEVYYLDENGNYTLHKNQKVRWSLASSSAIAKIDGEKGILKANKGASGEVKILCTADVAKTYSDKEGRKEISVNISNTLLPVKTITLNMKKTELDFDNGVYPEISANEVNKLRKQEIQDETTEQYSVISINSAVNKEGASLKDTTTFEWKSSKPSVAAIEVLPGGRSVRVTPKGKGTSQISCKAMDGSNKTIKCKVVVKLLTTDMTIKGQSSILLGKKATYKVTNVFAGYNSNGKKLVPNNKKVYWSLLDMSEKPLNINGVTINETNGKIKVESYADIKTNTDIYVVATTRDRGHLNQKYKVTLMGAGAAKATAVAVKFDDDYVYYPNYYVPTYKKNTLDLTAIKLHSDYATAGTTVASEVILKGVVSNGSRPVWSSSDSTVVGVFAMSENKAFLIGRKTGTATITCDAGDGSGKKAKVKVNVIIPASNIRIIDKKLDVYENGEDIGYSYLAKGGSTTLKANLGAVYGKPTIDKVGWEMEIVAYKRIKTDAGYRIKTFDLTSAQQENIKNKLYKIDANGVVSVISKKNFNDKSAMFGYYKDLGADGFAARVYATTKDGTETVAGRLIVAVDPLEDFRIYNNNVDKAVESYTLLTSNGLSAGMPINYKMGEDRELTSFTARSSDPTVLNAYVEITNKGNEQKANLNFVVTSEFANDKNKKEATVELTVFPNDGSNKEAKLKVTVKKQ